MILNPLAPYAFFLLSIATPTYRHTTKKEHNILAKNKHDYQLLAVALSGLVAAKGVKYA